VDQRTGDKAVQAERSHVLVRLVAGDGVGQAPADARGGLESSCAPTTVEVEVAVRGAADDGRGVGRDVDDAAPGPQEMCPREDREEFDGRGHLALDDMEGPALPVAVV